MTYPRMVADVLPTLQRGADGAWRSGAYEEAMFCVSDDSMAFNIMLPHAYLSALYMPGYRELDNNWHEH